MTSLRKLLLPAVASSALVLAACSSSNKTSTDTASTTSSSITTTTIVSDVTTTTAAAAPTLAPTTTAKRVIVATTSAATSPPATSPQIITSFSVSNPSACAAPDVTFQGPSPSVTVSWTVVGADSVTVSMDGEGGIWENGLPLSGSTTVPASCDASGHNVHTYHVIAIKNGSKIASKNATRGS